MGKALGEHRDANGNSETTGNKCAIVGNEADVVYKTRLQNIVFRCKDIIVGRGHHFVVGFAGDAHLCIEDIVIHTAPKRKLTVFRLHRCKCFVGLQSGLFCEDITHNEVYRAYQLHQGTLTLCKGIQQHTDLIVGNTLAQIPLYKEVFSRQAGITTQHMGIENIPQRIPPLHHLLVGQVFAVECHLLRCHTVTDVICVDHNIILVAEGTHRTLELSDQVCILLLQCGIHLISGWIHLLQLIQPVLPVLTLQALGDQRQHGRKHGIMANQHHFGDVGGCDLTGLYVVTQGGIFVEHKDVQLLIGIYRTGNALVQIRNKFLHKGFVDRFSLLAQEIQRLIHFVIESTPVKITVFIHHTDIGQGLCRIHRNTVANIHAQLVGSLIDILLIKNIAIRDLFGCLCGIIRIDQLYILYIDRCTCLSCRCIRRQLQKHTDTQGDRNNPAEHSF